VGGHAHRYEQARQVALGDGVQGWRYGLGVLAARGVAAWMATWAALTSTTAPDPSGTSVQAEPPSAAERQKGGAWSTGSACTPFPTPAAEAVVPVLVVAVLARMTLAHARNPIRQKGTLPVSIQPVHAGEQKVTAARLARDAYLCIRQSTLYQVANNTESTLRQYDLKGRAVALGWPGLAPRTGST